WPRRGEDHGGGKKRPPKPGSKRRRPACGRRGAGTRPRRRQQLFFDRGVLFVRRNALQRSWSSFEPPPPPPQPAHTPEPWGSFSHAGRAPLAGTFVEARYETRPGQEMTSGWKLPHVGADLGEEDLG